MKLSSLPPEERPRERLRRSGASALSLPELLAILLRTGTRGKDVLELVSELLMEYHDLQGLSRTEEEELMAFPGLGTGKASSLIAALELGRRLTSDRAANPKGEKWRGSLEKIASDLAEEDREYIHALHVRKNGTVIVADRISWGGIDGAYLDVKYLLRRAVRLNASGLVLIHNHPDGSLSPSTEDRMLTDFLLRRASILDISLIGHFVAAKGKWESIPVHGDAWKEGNEAVV